ncbi:unnamed protein product [Dovyalis caffra]|uniref:RIN4 pathogenic type III effector avirulence factor Avr cleavage site domain-containing protein n=1 Tax=Dovyalis caffra TaxID=77055 RepID=A0AAV1SH26_9ROSI|nr:unnamed protein product [Dovyalis caffra]
MAEKGQPLPKFGEWDVNDPASAEGFTERKKTGGKPDSPAQDGSTYKPGATATLGKPQTLFQRLSEQSTYWAAREIGNPLMAMKSTQNFIKKATKPARKARTRQTRFRSKTLVCSIRLD